MWKLAVAVIGLISIMANTSYAQQAPDMPSATPQEEPVPARTRMMEEVVVRAQRREESIRDVPIAVSAMTGAQMKNLGVMDTTDLGVVTPGFSYSDGAYGVPVYTLRGIGFNDTSYFSTPTTAVYVDEVNMPYAIMSKGPNIDMAQVEILKGPQGTMWGRGTTGGAINYIPNAPTEMFEAGITATHSRFDTRDIEAFISGGITDSLRYRVAGRNIERNEGWQYSQTDKSKTHGESDKYALRGLFDWDATENLSFRLMLRRWRDRSDAQAVQPLGVMWQNPAAEDDDALLDPGLGFKSSEVRDYPYRPNNTDNRLAEFCKGHPTDCHDMNGRDELGPSLDFKVNDTFSQAAIKSQWFLTDKIELNLLASYSKFKADNSQYPTGALPTQHAEHTIDIDMEVIDIEARLGGTNDAGTFRWMAGIHSTPRDTADQVLNLVFGGNSSVIFAIGDTGEVAFLDVYYPTLGETKYESVSPFGSIEWQFLDTFKLTLGARYTEEERSFKGCVTARERNTIHTLFHSLSQQRAAEHGTEPQSNEELIRKMNEGGCITIDEFGHIGIHEETIKENGLSFRSVIDWTPTPDHLFYVSYSRGFKSGGFPVNNAADQRQLSPVSQERLDAYEIGAKSGLFDQRVQLNFAAFYYDYKDKQLFSRFVDEIFGTLPALENAPESQVWGVEMDFQASPLAGLYISGAIAYIETEITEFDGFDTEGNAADLSGNKFNFSPRLSYSAIVDYAFPVWRDYEVGLGADYSHTGKTNSTIDGHPLFAHDDYGLTNARISFGRSDDRWKLTAWGRNIFNEFYTISVHSSVGDVPNRYAGMPQTYGVTFEYNFY